MRKIIMSIPIRDAMNKYSAIDSKRFSFFGLRVRREKKENMQEMIKKRATKKLIHLLYYFQHSP